MSLFSVASEYLRLENDDFSSQPTDIIIQSTSHNEFIIAGRFSKEKDPDDMRPPKREVLVNSSSEIQKLLSSFASKVLDDISFEGTVTELFICESNMQYAPISFSEYTETDGFISLTLQSQKVPQYIVDSVTSIVCSELQKIDEAVTIEDIKTIEVLFEQHSVASVQSIRGIISTPKPHKYHSDCQTVAEYINHKHTKTRNIQSASEQDVHEVFYRFGDAGTRPQEKLQTECKQVMENFIADSIWIKSNEQQIYSNGLYIGDFEAGTDQSIEMTVQLPIVDMEIGSK